MAVFIGMCCFLNWVLSPHVAIQVTLSIYIMEIRFSHLCFVEHSVQHRWCVWIWRPGGKQKVLAVHDKPRKNCITCAWRSGLGIDHGPSSPSHKPLRVKCRQTMGPSWHGSLCFSIHSKWNAGPVVSNQFQLLDHNLSTRTEFWMAVNSRSCNQHSSVNHWCFYIRRAVSNVHPLCLLHLWACIRCGSSLSQLFHGNDFYLQECYCLVRQ